jgi:hypothetical protein
LALCKTLLPDHAAMVNSQSEKHLSPACLFVLGAANAFAYVRHPGLAWQFRRRLGYFPNAARPGTYHEKVHWRKVFDRNPEIARLSDKLQAREEFKAAGLQVHLPELLWVGDRPEDMPVSLLDRRAVIKTNHGSGFNYFTETANGDFDDMCRIVNGWLGHYPYGRTHGEWGYFNIHRQVYVEELIEDASGNKPLLINIHTFSGVPVMSWVAQEFADRPRQAANLDRHGRRYPQGGEMVDDLPADFELPDEYFQAVDHAAVLGRHIDYARIDFMLSDGKLYGSEFTFYTLGGLVRYHDDVSQKLAAAWDLRQSWFFQTAQHGWRKTYTAFLDQALHR